MGLSLAAFAAGATPKTMPTKAETPKARAIAQGVTVVVKKRPIKKEKATPRVMPMRPPKNDKTTASIKN